jgi:hypothetical protein
VLATFGNSARARALHATTEPPAGWKTVHNHGITARIPDDWPVLNTTGGTCSRPVTERTAELITVINQGAATSGPPRCELGGRPVEGLRLWPPVPPEMQNQATDNIVETRHINGLDVGIIDMNSDPGHSVIHFIVRNAAGETIHGDIGAGNDANVAAGILASLQPDP